MTREPLRSHIHFPGLALTIYREIAAHLRQVDGVQTGLLPQQSQAFDYYESQVGVLWIQYPENADAACRQRVEQILAYYSDRYCPYQKDTAQALS